MTAENLDADDTFGFYTIFDDLTMGEQEGFEMPDWLTKELYDEIKQYLKISFDNFVATKTLRKLNAGLFLGNVKNKIESLVGVKPDADTLSEISKGFKRSTKKLNIYSTVRAFAIKQHWTC